MAQPLGPLVPARTNPRYFAVAHAEGVDERLVYLTARMSTTTSTTG